jgi:hypothetical protein
LANQCTDNRTNISTGETATGWEDIAGTAHTVDGEVSYDTYTGSIGLYATTTRDGIFYNNGATGLFTSGDVAYLLVNCGIVSLLDTQANGGMTVRVTGATATDWKEVELFGSNVWPTAFDGGWIQIVVDIDDLLTNFTNQNGSPPTVGNIQRFGVTFITATVMPRMADNCWAGGFKRLPSNTPAIIVEGRDGGTTDWDLDSIAANANVQLSAVLKPGPGGTCVARGPIQFGINDASTHAFTDSNKTLLWDTQDVMVDGFYKLSALGNSGGTTNITFGIKTGTGNDATGAQGGAIQAASAAARWDMDFDDPNVDGVNLYGMTLQHGGTFELDDPAVDIATVFMIDCDKAHFSNAKVVRLNVVAPNTADGVAFCDTDDLTDIANSTFEFSDGHGIEVLSGGPASQANVGNIFLGSYGGTPGDNNTPSSGSNDAMIYNNSTAAKTFNRSGGGTQPSFRNGASATSDDVAAITLTFTPLITNSEVRVYANATGTEITGVENSGASFVASGIGASQAIDYKIINPGYLEINVKNVSFAASQNVIVNQQVDRNFSEDAA